MLMKERKERKKKKEPPKGVGGGEGDDGGGGGGGGEDGGGGEREQGGVETKITLFFSGKTWVYITFYAGIAPVPGPKCPFSRNFEPGGGYSDLGWVRMCGPEFQLLPYSKTWPLANSQPISKPHFSTGTHVKTNQCHLPPYKKTFV